MRKTGVALSTLGAFLLVLGLLLAFYAPSRLQKTPLDVDSTTRLSGTAELQTAEALENFPVKAVSVTRTNSAKSTGKVVVFVNSACLVRDEGDVPDCVSNDDPDKRLVSASVSNFATDRHTAVAVNDPKLLPADATKVEGLVNKFPFGSEKKTYPYWDSLTDATAPAKYDGTTTIDGLELYKYKIVIEGAPIQIAEGVDGTYDDEKVIYVEPVTGAIVNQVEKQARKTADGAPVLDLSLAFTDAQVKEGVADAKSNKSQLQLVTKTVPLIAVILGLLLLAGGIVLSLRSGSAAAGSAGKH